MSVKLVMTHVLVGIVNLLELVVALLPHLHHLLVQVADLELVLKFLLLCIPRDSCHGTLKNSLWLQTT